MKKKILISSLVIGLILLLVIAGSILFYKDNTIITNILKIGTNDFGRNKASYDSSKKYCIYENAANKTYNININDYFKDQKGKYYSDIEYKKNKEGKYELDNDGNRIITRNNLDFRVSEFHNISYDNKYRTATTPIQIWGGDFSTNYHVSLSAGISTSKYGSCIADLTTSNINTGYKSGIDNIYYVAHWIDIEENRN